jgi:GNAT superfamily N-acetyltransferase
VTPSGLDRRVRTAVLTPAGAAERRVLDRRSDALAASFLEPLGDADRRRLVDAMAEVEKLLTVAMLDFSTRDPDHPDAQHCLREYFAELDRRFDLGFDPSRTVPAREFRAPGGLFLVASLRSEPIACGALKFHGKGPADIKRMWVADSARGLGIGRRLLAELEARAARHGCRRVRLETNRALTEAIAMYRSAGYVEVAPFNDEPYAHHWFDKPLASRTRPRKAPATSAARIARPRARARSR